MAFLSDFIRRFNLELIWLGAFTFNDIGYSKIIVKGIFHF